MPAPPRLQYTSVRTRVVDGQVVIALKHTGKDQAGATVKLPWIERPPGDTSRPTGSNPEKCMGLGGPTMSDTSFLR